MRTLPKAVLAALFATAPLAGCATGGAYDYNPYYGYNTYGSPAYTAPRYYGDRYYDPYYIAPSTAPGYTYSDRDYRRYPREYRDRDGRVYRDGVLYQDVPRDVPRNPDGTFAPDGGKDARDANSASPG